MNKIILKFKNIFFEILSFGSPRAIVFNISLIFILLASIPTKLLIYSPAKCVFKHIIFPFIFGGVCPDSGLFAYCDCPACGMTRGMSRFLHGDFQGAWAFNKGVFMVFIVMLVLIMINLNKMYVQKGKIFK